MHRIYRLLPWLLPMLVAGCGFHLRGQVELPAGMEPVYIGGAYGNLPLGEELRKTLTTAGVNVTGNIGQARLLVLINKRELDWRTLSVGDGMLAAEYQLFESVVYEFRRATGEVVFGPNKLVESRVLPYNANQVISTGEEEQILRREMKQHLAQKIARQLQAIDIDSVNAPTTDTHETAP